MNYFILAGVVTTLLLSIITYFLIFKDTALKTSRLLLILSVILLGGSGVLLIIGLDLVAIVLLVLSLVLISWATKDIGRAGYNSKWLAILGVISGVISLGLLVAQQLNINIPSFSMVEQEFSKIVKGKDFVIVEKPKVGPSVPLVPLVPVSASQVSVPVPSVPVPVLVSVPVPETCAIRQVTPKFDASLLLSQMNSSQPNLSSLQSKLQDAIRSRSIAQGSQGSEELEFVGTF